MIKKILIANRGEIAVRIIRACRQMGIKSVAIYSVEDKEGLHVKLADQRICIGEGPARNSYLNKESIITAALNIGADAIHPGFGFLSENAAFARMCQENGITFIGPAPEVMEQMGDKAQARATMLDVGVPIVPGTQGTVNDVSVAISEAKRIGFPIMIKAAGGGGGKGMRVAYNLADFEHLFNVAQTESINAFANDAMYLERFIKNPKHVEIQVIGDHFGNIVSLGERDCSVQRNHQKLVEESPSPATNPELRAAMNADALKAAQAVNYTNAGTIEFILDDSGDYYFMEMNTRIQVEHGVTELVTGIDLIVEQINIANNQVLSFQQEDLSLRGHAIECRINAEIPEKNFMANPGTVTHIHFPAGNGVRVDSALYQGYTIPSEYDSMIAKILVHAPNRQAAIMKMRAALEEMVILGVETNLDFQYQVLGHPEFIEGTIDTGFIARMMRMDER